MNSEKRWEGGLLGESQETCHIALDDAKASGTGLSRRKNKEMKRLVAILLMMVVVAAVVNAQAVRESKRGILLTYYGTSEDSARMVSLDAMTESVRRAFPETPVYEAFTSKAAIHALKRRKGITKWLFSEALDSLYAAQYTDVIAVCCEMIEGQEARYMKRHIDLRLNKFFAIRQTSPLLYTYEDTREVMQLMTDIVKADDDEQVVLVGHGRDGAANDVYCLADYILQHEGHEQYHVGTISGYPSLQNIKDILRKSGTRKVVLAPLIVAAAGHATKDIFVTWRKALEKEGYQVRLVRQGVLEYPAMRQLIINKIKKELSDDK